eukprot:tig00020556_g11042.t1
MRAAKEGTTGASRAASARAAAGAGAGAGAEQSLSPRVHELDDMESAMPLAAGAALIRALSNAGGGGPAPAHASDSKGHPRRLPPGSAGAALAALAAGVEWELSGYSGASSSGPAERARVLSDVQLALESGTREADEEDLPSRSPPPRPAPAAPLAPARSSGLRRMAGGAHHAPQADAVPLVPAEAGEAADPALLLELFAELAQCLARNGVPTYRLDGFLESVADRFALRIGWIILPTYLIIASSEANTHSPAPRFPTLCFKYNSTYNLSKIHRLHCITESVLAGQCTPSAALGQIRELRRPEKGVRAGTLVASYAASGALYAVLMEGQFVDAVAALCVGVASGCCAALGRRYPTAGRFAAALASFFAVIVAGLLTLAFPSMNPTLSVTAGVALFLPGISFTVANLELAMRKLQVGSMRLLASLLALVQMTFGFIVAAWLVELATGRGYEAALVRTQEPTSLCVACYGVAPRLAFAAAAAAGLSVTCGVFFNSRREDWAINLAICEVACLVKALRLVAPLPVASCIAAFAMGLAGNFYARRSRRPSMVPVLLAQCVLVPGSFGLRALQQALEGSADGSKEPSRGARGAAGAGASASPSSESGQAGARSFLDFTLIAFGDAAGLVAANAALPAPRHL